MKNEILFTLLKEAQITENLSHETIEKLTLEIENEELKTSFSTVTPYPPYNVELSIKRVNFSLNALLSKREELKNLEVALLNAALNKLTFKEHREKEIALRQLNKNSNKLINESLLKQRELIQDGNTFSGSVESIKEIEEYERVQNDLLESFNDKIYALNDEFQKFADDPNCGLNFLSRYSKLREIYEDDYRTFYQYITTYEIGLRTVYKLYLPLPSFAEPDLLNAYYLWFKKSLLKLDNVLISDREYPMIMSFKAEMNPTLDLTSHFTIKIGYPDGANFKTKLDESGDIYFKIEGRNIEPYLNCRLKGLNIYHKATNPSAIFRIELTPPQQVDANGVAWQASTIFLNSEHFQKYDKETLFITNDSFNINPFNDNFWRLRITYYDQTEFAEIIKRQKIDDFRLV